MTTLIALAAILVFTIAEAYSDAWIFKSVKAKGLFYAADSLIEQWDANQKWHFWQAVRQGTFIVFAAIFAGHWAVALFTASLFWLIHDGIVNVIGLDRKFFFVGTTAWFDKTFRRLFPGNPSAAMAVTKFGMLAASAAAYFIF